MPVANVKYIDILSGWCGWNTRIRWLWAEVLALVNTDNRRKVAGVVKPAKRNHVLRLEAHLGEQLSVVTTGISDAAEFLVARRSVGGVIEGWESFASSNQQVDDGLHGLSDSC